jgi:hypothetical protein
MLPRRTLNATAAALAAGLLVTALACNDDSTAPASGRTVYGPSQSLGQGVARTYVTLDAADRPTAIGVALSETALNALPATPMPGMPMGAMLMLSLPNGVPTTGFDHVELDWNPQGHEPETIYTLPHFDFHFYTISAARQQAMTPADAQFDAKLEKVPAKEFQPPAPMAKLPGGVPMMGAHWVDMTSPELLPPPNAKTFTRTFMYGSYDGEMIFAEPMITKATIEGARTATAPSTQNVPAPARWAKAGWYPTSYTIAWNADAKEYRIALDGLVQRN